MRALPFLAALALAAPPAAAGDAVSEVRVAAAADLAPAFATVDQAATSAVHVKMVLSIGSTGLLSRQIIEGAPFDLFAAASARYVDDVVKAGACDGSTRVDFARGRLALWSPAPLSKSGLAALTDPKVKKIAIANPEHAPYGAAAKEALVHAKLWDAVSSKIVYGENVQQTMQLASSGNVDVAIVALSSATAAPKGTIAIVDESLYAPLRQQLVVCARTPERAAAAQKLVAFLTSSDGRAILAKYGFASTP